MAKKKAKSKAVKSTKSMSAAMAAKPVAPSKVVNKSMTTKQLTMTFGVWYLAHVVIFFLANQFFPNSVALGTDLLSTWQALLLSMLVLTSITVGFIPVVEMIATAGKRAMSGVDWMVTYFVINAVGIWVVARFAEQLGMGISSWVVAVVMALVIDAVQGLLITKAV